jgi:hypothetical protein
MVVKISVITAKLAPFATRTTDETDFVPPAQGTTHLPEALEAAHEDPGPTAGSKPAEKARDWKRVME